MSSYNYKRASTYSTNEKISFNRSEQKALDYGFRVVLKADAYNGRYFIKDHKIWIHNIGALKRQLGISSDYELEDMGYDVDTYYEAN